MRDDLPTGPVASFTDVRALSGCCTRSAPRMRRGARRAPPRPSARPAPRGRSRGRYARRRPSSSLSRAAPGSARRRIGLQRSALASGQVQPGRSPHGNTHLLTDEGYVDEAAAAAHGRCRHGVRCSSPRGAQLVERDLHDLGEHRLKPRPSASTSSDSKLPYAQSLYRREPASAHDALPRPRAGTGRVVEASAQRRSPAHAHRPRQEPEAQLALQRLASMPPRRRVSIRSRRFAVPRSCLAPGQTLDRGRLAGAFPRRRCSASSSDSSRSSMRLAPPTCRCLTSTSSFRAAPTHLRERHPVPPLASSTAGPLFTAGEGADRPAFHQQRPRLPCTSTSFARARCARRRTHSFSPQQLLNKNSPQRLDLLSPRAPILGGGRFARR